MTMNNWCLGFLLTIASLTLLIGDAEADETSGGSCSASAGGSPAAEELRAKIDELEKKLADTRREAGKLRLKVYELKKEVKNQTEEVTRSEEKRTQLEETEKQCREERASCISHLGGSNRENRLKRKAVILCEGLKEKVEQDLKQVSAELEEARAGSCSGKAASPGAGREDLESLREELSNCEETVKAVRERCDRDSNDLKRIGRTHERLRKSLENCTENTRQCEGERDHLAFLKRGYEVVVKQLEKDTQDAKDNKERSEASEKEAIRGVSKYRLYLAGIGVLALIGATVKVYSFVKTKMAERLAALAEAKHKDKLDTKRRGLVSSSRQKKKLS